MSDRKIWYASLGLVVLDEIRFHGEKTLTNMLGGSAVYATLGARLFLPSSQARSIGFMIHIGYDFPRSAEEQLKSWETTLIVHQENERLSTRGLLEYEDTTFGPKKFMYTTPVLAIKTERLNTTEILSSKAFHFLEEPQNLESRISSLLALRESAGITERPLIIWEPAPPSCKPENLATCLTVARRVDVFSPNHIELLGLYGEPPPSTLDRTRMEALALNFIDSGIGPDRAGVVVVRAGEHGAMLRSRGSSPRWLPPFYESTPDGHPDPKVVDPTGAGNAFLGAYAVGFLKTGDNIQAACYGAVGASFALEQVAVPEKTCTEDKELWNGVNVQDRLREYTSKLAAGSIYLSRTP